MRPVAGRKLLGQLTLAGRRHGRFSLTPANKGFSPTALSLASVSVCVLFLPYSSTPIDQSLPFAKQPHHDPLGLLSFATSHDSSYHSCFHGTILHCMQNLQTRSRLKQGWSLQLPYSTYPLCPCQWFSQGGLGASHGPSKIPLGRERYVHTGSPQHGRKCRPQQGRPYRSVYGGNDVSL